MKPAIDLAWNDLGDFLPEYDSDGLLVDFLDTVDSSVLRRRSDSGFVELLQDELSRRSNENPQDVKDSLEWYNVLDHDYYGTVVEIIRDRLKTNAPDWEPYPNLGANLEDFIGEKVRTTTYVFLQNQIENSLMQDGLLSDEDFDVIVVDDTPGNFIIVIKVYFPDGEESTINVLFSFAEGIKKIFV